jgi:hypothetical protein
MSYRIVASRDNEEVREDWRDRSQDGEVSPPLRLLNCKRHRASSSRTKDARSIQSTSTLRVIWLRVRVSMSRAMSIDTSTKFNKTISDYDSGFSSSPKIPSGRFDYQLNNDLIEVIIAVREHFLPIPLRVWI